MPTSPNNSSSQARSSGRKPEFFWLPRQFFDIDVLVRDVPVTANHVMPPIPRPLRQAWLQEIHALVFHLLAFLFG